MNAPISLRNAASEFAFIRPCTLPKNAGSSYVASVTLVTTPKLPPPPPFNPEEIRIGGGVGDQCLAVCGNDLCLQEACCGQAVILREAAEATTLDQSRDTDGCAPATLD